MTEELIKLAERVEAAEGADREIDGLIDRLINNRPSHGDYDAGENALWRCEDSWSGLLVRADGFARGSFCALRYTASIDAAMSLVPEGLQFEVTTTGYKPGATVCGNSLTGVHEGAYAATPALALCAAAIRARASTSSKGES